MAFAHQHPDGRLTVDIDAVIAATRAGETKIAISFTAGRQLLTVLLCVSAAIALLVSVAFIVLAVVHARGVTRHLNAIHAAGAAHSGGYEGVYLAEKTAIFYHAHQCEFDTERCAVEPVLLDYAQRLSKAEMQMRMHNNQRTYGRYGPGVGSSAYRFLTDTPLAMRSNPYDNHRFFYWVTMTDAADDETTLYARLRTQIATRGAPDSMWATMALGSGYFTDLVNFLRHTPQFYWHDLQFFTDSAVDVFLVTYPRLGRAFTADIDTHRSYILVGLIVFAGVFVLMLLTGVASLYINIYWLARNRLQLVGVFTTIPKLFLEQLHEETAQRLDSFDSNTNAWMVGRQGQQQQQQHPCDSSWIGRASPDGRAVSRSHSQLAADMPDRGDG